MSEIGSLSLERLNNGAHFVFTKSVKAGSAQTSGNTIGTTSGGSGSAGGSTSGGSTTTPPSESEG